ncbi:hypothetical protein ACJJTC_008499 [Scirpophaga incertulas]
MDKLTLSLFYQNVRGVKSKILDIYKSILCNNYDVICLTETWLDDTVCSKELIDDRYIVYRRDRSDLFKEKYNKAYGGGVLVAVRKTIKSYQLTDIQSSGIFFSIIEKHTPKFKPRKATYPFWFSRNLISILKEKDRYHQKFKKYGNPRDNDTFSLLRGRAKDAMDKCFYTYISNIEKKP